MNKNSITYLESRKSALEAKLKTMQNNNIF